MIIDTAAYDSIEGLLQCLAFIAMIGCSHSIWMIVKASKPER